MREPPDANLQGFRQAAPILKPAGIFRLTDCIPFSTSIALSLKSPYR
jgi:hypothetical protein